jgi:hypothetical protein
MPTFQTIADRDDAQDLSEMTSELAHSEQEPGSEPEPEAEVETESEQEEMDLDAFLSQFVLIKTPYGYILARAPQHDAMSRARRGRNKAESNFQLRVRKSGERDEDRLANWMEMYRDRKASGAPFKAQHNFQLRVRKSSGPHQLPQQAETGSYQGMRVRKALLQEIRDRRRSMADHSNSNFQLRVRKSPERSFGPGQNFQLRVRRSA